VAQGDTVEHWVACVGLTLLICRQWVHQTPPSEKGGSMCVSKQSKVFQYLVHMMVSVGTFPRSFRPGPTHACSFHFQGVVLMATSANREPQHVGRQHVHQTTPIEKGGSMHACQQSKCLSVFSVHDCSCGYPIKFMRPVQHMHTHSFFGGWC
jgi:hypothetical protein